MHQLPERRLPAGRIASSRPALTLALAAALAGCGDAATAPDRPRGAGAPEAGQGAAAGGDFDRYVAIGTSVSQGWRDDGVHAALQETSWPAQLARLGGSELSLPRIALPGCGAPLAAPLASGVRISGEAAAAPLLSRQCAPNLAGATLSAGNVAINGARTIHALTATPENPDPNNAPLYARVLLPGMSQVAAMEARDPEVVSVELGANDLLGVTEGAYVPGGTVVPVFVWAPQFRQVVERVARVAERAVLVGLIDHAANLPAFRTGAELWDARATFAPFNVAVSDDCRESENVLFVPVRVPTVVGQGVARDRAGQPPAELSCANFPNVGPDGAVIRDRVLSPADLALTDAQLAAMNVVIRGEAAQRGFAYFALSVLYEEANRKAPFDARVVMTSPQPYGPLFSLDGIHPSAEGSRVLAEAAARALAARYGGNAPPAVEGLRADPAAGPYSVAAKACGGRFTVCVRFQVADADGAADAPFAVTLDWGDGTQWKPNSVPAATPLLAPHDYAAPGTYRVTVTVTDRRGATGTAATTLTVTP